MRSNCSSGGDSKPCGVEDEEVLMDEEMGENNDLPVVELNSDMSRVLEEARKYESVCSFSILR